MFYYALLFALSGLGLLCWETSGDLAAVGAAYLDLILGRPMSRSAWYLVLLGAYTVLWVTLCATSVPELIRPPKPKLEPLGPLPEDKKWALERNHPAIVPLSIDVTPYLSLASEREKAALDTPVRVQPSTAGLTPLTGIGGEEDLSALGILGNSAPLPIDNIIAEFSGSFETQLESIAHSLPQPQQKELVEYTTHEIAQHVAEDALDKVLPKDRKLEAVKQHQAQLSGDMLDLLLG